MSDDEKPPRERTKKPGKRHVLPQGEGSFYYREKDQRWVGTIEAGWNAKGKRQRIVVTSKDEQQAWDKLQVKRKQVMTHGRAAALQGSITLASWCRKWLTIQEKRLRPSSYTGAASYVKKWIIPNVGNVNVEDISAHHVRKVSRAVLDAGKSGTTAATVQGTLQKILRDALVEGYQVGEAALKVPRPKKEDTRKRTAIPLDQCWKFVHAAAEMDDGSRWVMAFIQGMRPAECLGLTWDRVDLENSLIDVSWQLKPIPYKVPRNRSSGFRMPDSYEAIWLEDAYHLVRPKSLAGKRVIPLIPWMAKLLKEWKEVAPKSPHGLVYPRASGAPKNSKDDVREWKAIQDQLKQWKEPPHKVDGVDIPAAYWEAYEIRHSTATVLLDAGVDTKIVEAIMGHSDIAVTRGYQHVDMEMMKLALEAVAKKLTEKPDTKLLES